MEKHQKYTYTFLLLNKFIRNECTPEELHYLINWLKTNDELNEFDEATSSFWQTVQTMKQLPFQTSDEQLNQEVNILLTKLKTSPPVQIPQRRLFFRKALSMVAVFLLLFIVGIGVYLFNRQPATELLYTEIITPYGETHREVLPDGTVIVLNSGSKLRVPANYGENERCVDMTGEGFFDVAKDPGKPFVVKNGEAQVAVLGTSFNFRSYCEDELLQVTVSTGKVLVKVPAIDLQLQVTPNEHLTVNKQNGDISKVTLTQNNYSRWIEGALYFEKESLSEVIRTINRKYNSNVVLAVGYEEHQISGVHDNKSLEAVIDAICFTTGLKSRVEENRILLYK